MLRALPGVFELPVDDTVNDLAAGPETVMVLLDVLPDIERTIEEAGVALEVVGRAPVPAGTRRDYYSLEQGYLFDQHDHGVAAADVAAKYPDLVLDSEHLPWYGARFVELTVRQIVDGHYLRHWSEDPDDTEWVAEGTVDDDPLGDSAALELVADLRESGWDAVCDVLADAGEEIDTRLAALELVCGALDGSYDLGPVGAEAIASAGSVPPKARSHARQALADLGARRDDLVELMPFRDIDAVLERIADVLGRAD